MQSLWITLYALAFVVASLLGGVTWRNNTSSDVQEVEIPFATYYHMAHERQLPLVVWVGCDSEMIRQKLSGMYHIRVLVYENSTVQGVVVHAPSEGKLWRRRENMLIPLKDVTAERLLYEASGKWWEVQATVKTSSGFRTSPSSSPRC